MKSSRSAAMTATTTRIVKMLKGVRASVSPPTLTPVRSKAAGKERKLLPKTIAASAWSTMKRPSVRITGLMWLSWSTYRTTRRSTRAPRTRPAMSATMNPIQ
ncbi:hypothetical protein LP422_22645 [Janibacter limosus]|nr:hypothetical protein LP422_22645 [Janibacter limosus]